MARPLRLNVRGGFYHVVSRGNERRTIYPKTEDRRRFLVIFEKVTKTFNVRCHSYCLMGNHYHLLLETPDGNISKAIRQLNGVYAQWFNRRHQRVGHLFQGRFTSRLIDVDAYLLAVARYIVQNPVRANLVAHPSSWIWSSYRALAGMVEPPAFLTTNWLLQSFDSVDRNRARKRYCRFIDTNLQDDDERIRGSGPILGSDAFIQKHRCEIAESTPLQEIPREQRFAARRPLESIFRSARDRATRNTLIHEAHIQDGYTMLEIANHLQLHALTISRVMRSINRLR